LNLGLCAILLAAGSSSRFGSNKLLHPLAGDIPIALAALANLRAAIPRVIAVVRPGVPVLENRLSEAGATVILCPDADQGMGASLATAVRASGDVDGWVVALADMPFIRPETIARVRESIEAGAPIAAPVFRGERGHPVGFAASFRRELEVLGGDEGARALLQAHAAELERIEVDDPGVCRDVDTPADL
jgi:molybdenum cofactor cytidylyltransferase